MTKTDEEVVFEEIPEGMSLHAYNYRRLVVEEEEVRQQIIKKIRRLINEQQLRHHCFEVYNKSLENLDADDLYEILKHYQ